MTSEHQKLNQNDFQEYLNGLRQSLLESYCSIHKIDRAEVQKSIRQLYQESGRPEPIFRWYSNPRELQNAAQSHPATEAFRITPIEEKCGKKLRQALEASISAEDFNEAFTMLWDTLPSSEVQSLPWQVRLELGARPTQTVEINQRESFDRIVSSMIHPETAPGPIHEIEWTSLSLIRLAIAQMACEFFEVKVESTEKTIFDCLLALARNAHAYICFENECLLSEAPLEFYCDDQFRSHNPTGPAIVYSDELKIFCWRGSRVPESVMTRDANLKTIDEELNIESRRVIIERYGTEQFLLDSGAEIRQRDKFGSLYVKEVWGDEDIVMVHLTNSSPEPDGQFRTYFLRVPPNIRTAREAVAWSFGMTADEYDPLIES